MRQPTTLLFIGIGGILLIMIAVYFIFFRQPAPDVVVEEGGSFGVSDDFVPIKTQEEQPLGQVGGQAGEEVAPNLVRITEGPVAFGVSVASLTKEVQVGTSTEKKNDIEVRYIERASGNAYAYQIGERSLTRLSNRTLPGVYEASWLSDGSLAYLRFLSENDGKEVVETYALQIGSGSGGYFLEPNLSEVLTKGTSTVVTLLESTNGSVGTIATPDGADVRTFFSSALTNIRLGFAGTNLVAHTKASAQVQGYSFLVNRATGAFERIAGPSRGLMALPSPKGTYVLHSSLSGSALRLELLETASRTVTALPLGTFADKCVWAADESAVYCAAPRTISGTLPDDWYQGAVSFSDRIWRIDLGGRVALLVVDPASVAGEEVDAVSLSLDPSSEVLVFTNKKDGSLWSFDLTP